MYIISDWNFLFCFFFLMQCLVFYENIIVLTFNRIIFLFLWSFHEVCSFSHITLHHFINHDITHIMNDMILISEVVQILFNMIRKLWTEITEFKVSWTVIFIFSQDDNMNLSTVSKSEKFSDLFMFDDDQKQLCLFIMKLCLKLERNADQFSTDADKINYEISWLEENAAVIIDFFYQNNFLINLNTLIKFLKMIYDDVS